MEHVDHLVVVGCIKGAYADSLEHRVVAVGSGFEVLAEHVVGVFFLIGHQGTDLVDFRVIGLGVCSELCE